MTKMAKKGVAAASEAPVVLTNVLRAEYYDYYSQQPSNKSFIIHTQRAFWDITSRRLRRLKMN